MKITEILDGLQPETLRERFHEIGNLAQEKEAKIADVRAEFEAGRKEIDRIRERLKPLREKIKAHNKEMGPIMRARSMIAKALKGRTGRPPA